MIEVSMHIPPVLHQLAQTNPIIHNGLQLHLVGGASLTTALATIIEALVEVNASQHKQLLQMLQEPRTTFFLKSGEARN
jgi:hypothetical protein